jgi:titin
VSGNIKIDVVDTNNSPTNQVYYYVYYYRTGDTGPNNSANILMYSNTYIKRIVSSTAASFYLNDLSNNQYTVYVATKNDFGSNLFSQALPPIQVYITPLVPEIDNANTLSKSSGNLTVSIVDMVNLPTNAVYYWYSINGGVYGNTGISKISGVSRYSYDIPTSQISNGNTYIVRVKTVNPIGQSATVSTSNPTEVYTTPEIPVLYSVVAQDSAMDIAFSTPYNNGNAISKYEYILNGSSVGTLNTTLVNSQNTARISGLINGIQYSVGVRAVNARGPSGLSSTQSTIPFGVPFIPDVNVVPNNNSLDIYFTTPNDNGNTITRYEYSLYGGSLSSPINTISLASNNHYTDTNVTNGIQYSVVVRAVNARGAGAWSTIVSATPYTNPSAPIVKLESLSGAFRIYFDTPYNGGVPITYYQYELNGSGNYTQFTGTDSNNSFIVSGVDGTPYTIRVRTFNANNRISEWSSPVSVTPFSIPDSPVLRTAEAGIGSIPISFSASTYNGGNTITRYEYTTNNGNSFATMGLPTTVNENGYITYEITYQSINGSVPLVNGTPYTIQLRAVNARGPSISFSGSIAVIPFNRPDPPTIDSVTPNNHIITILFSAPASDGGNPIISYEYSINGGANYDTIQNIDVTAKQIQFTVTGLENGNVFSVSVRSRNSRGASNGSNTIEAIPYGIPDPPAISGVSKNTRLDIVFDTPNRRGKALVGYEYFVEPISITYKRISSILPLNDMSQNVFTIYGLTNGETYAVNVRTVNGFGTSTVSNTIQISPSTTPEAPTINQAIPLPGAINVVFNTVANTGGNTITGYKYAYYLGGV